MRAVARGVTRAQAVCSAPCFVRCQSGLSLEAGADVDPRRKNVSIFGKSPVVSPDAFVAPSATVIGDVCLADKSGVWYNSVLRGDLNPIDVGYCSHIKDGSVVCVDGSLAPGYDSSTVIGNFVTVGSRCYLKACTLQNHVTLGDGCIVQEGALIEEGAALAAGTVVPPGVRIPAGELWGGNPVAFVKKLEKSSESAESTAQSNFDLGQEHEAEFLPHGTAYQELVKA